MSYILTDFWLLKKHKGNFEITNFDYKQFRAKVFAESIFMESEENSELESVFNWDVIRPSYNLKFDFIGNEEYIKSKLVNSELLNHPYVFVETLACIPILRVSTKYFIQNWFDFISANQGMGSIVITDDLKFILEFTNDASYVLYTNFRV